MSRALLIVSAGALALGLTAGAWIEQQRLGSQIANLRTAHAEQLRSQAEASAATLEQQQAARLALEDRLRIIDTTHYQELTNARAENDRLRADLRATTRRLSIRTTATACPAGSVPAAPGAPGLDPAAGRAEIHPADAEALVGIAGEADACAVTLAALQEWARVVTRGD